MEDICNLFQSEKPFLIGRNGTIELEILLNYYYILNILESQKNTLELNAGIFPTTNEYIEDFCRSYIEALTNTDIIAEGWYEPLKKAENNLLNILNPNRIKVTLRNLEPYYAPPHLRWTQYLANKRVAIINSFAETCEQQTYMSKAIWPEYTESFLPNSTTWIPITTYYCPKLAGENTYANWPSHIKNFKDAIEYIIERTLESKAEVAIIGCGGMGMIIGSKLKDAGLQVIVMGGATQILFGIKGKRWENHSIISKFFNDAWVSPNPLNAPKNYKLIENGCYW
jgi:hypothetical protein